MCWKHNRACAQDATCTVLAVGFNMLFVRSAEGQSKIGTFQNFLCNICNSFPMYLHRINTAVQLLGGWYNKCKLALHTGQPARRNTFRQSLQCGCKCSYLLKYDHSVFKHPQVECCILSNDILFCQWNHWVSDFSLWLSLCLCACLSDADEKTVILHLTTTL